MRNRTPRPVGFIVVTTDKGLCGGLNTNVLRAVTTSCGVQRGQKDQAVAIGNKGFGFLNRIGAKVVSARHPAGRHAAPRQADRPGQGHARRVRRRASSTRCTSATPASSTR
jgi:F0F1-type ATP synthase gamma subunit